MKAVGRIAALLQETMGGPGWHGPGLLQVLEGVDAEQAATHPIEGVHSIHEIVKHLISWHEIALERLAGIWIAASDARDWPPVPGPDEVAWQRDLDRLREVLESTRSAVLGLDDAALDRPLPGRQGVAPSYLTLHGVIHHDVWHAGQISLLMRALGRPSYR